MMTSIQTYVRRGRHTLHRLTLDPRSHAWGKAAAWAGAGFLLSAASLGNAPQPLTLGLLCACSGWPAALTALGGAAGYWMFWGAAGLQCIAWLGLGLVCALALGDRPITRQTPLLMCAIAAWIVAATGVVFQQFFGDETAIPTYLLRVALGASTARVAALAIQRADPIADWLAWGLATLALAQVSPLPNLNLGLVAAGALAAVGPFPAAALSGLALDLAQISRVPMSAVVCLAYFVRLIPWMRRWGIGMAPGAVYLLFSGLWGGFAVLPAVPLALGGAVGVLLPRGRMAQPRRGEVGVAQVRLEMAAGVMAQTEQLLLEAAEPAVDERALLQRMAERACGACPCRRECRAREEMALLPPGILRNTLATESDLPAACRKRGRVLLELRRSQEQYRAILADHSRQREYRAAAVQQYQFLASFLRDLSDALARRGREPEARYEAGVAVCANRREADNGDRCLYFAGVGCRYYVLLCDGMGTGIGAVDEGNTAGRLLKRLLCAGFPAQHALRSLNSLCALRGRAGAVAVDMAELELDTGRATVYKWGAVPSYLVTHAGVEKIGTAGPPPGLWVAEGREMVERLSLRRGETLVLLSDGVGGEDARSYLAASPDATVGEIAAEFLERGEAAGKDDATVVAVRLTSPTSVT